MLNVVFYHIEYRDYIVLCANITSIFCLAQSRPYTRDLHNHVIPHVGDKWYELGIQLLDANQESKLRSIRANHVHDVKKCCSEMFDYWLETHPDGSWDQLVRALRQPAVELNNLAHSIGSRFTGMFMCVYEY